MTATIPVFWGKDLSVLEKSRKMEAFCKECPKCEIYNEHRYATAEDTPDFGNDRVFVKGYYWCSCDLYPDHPDCIYDPELEEYCDE